MARPNFEAIIKNPSLAAAAVSDATWRGELSLADISALHPAVKARLEQIASDYATFGTESLNAQMLGLEQAYSKFMINASQETDPHKADRWLQLALKCQEQFRKCLETVHEIRNPSRTAFIRTYVESQLNQLAINNPEKPLELGEFNHEPMDRGTAATAARNSIEAQALVEIDRAEDTPRQGNLF